MIRHYLDAPNRVAVFESSASIGVPVSKHWTRNGNFWRTNIQQRIVRAWWGHYCNIVLITLQDPIWFWGLYCDNHFSCADNRGQLSTDFTCQTMFCNAHRGYYDLAHSVALCFVASYNFTHAQSRRTLTDCNLIRSRHHIVNPAPFFALFCFLSHIKWHQLWSIHNRIGHETNLLSHFLISWIPRRSRPLCIKIFCGNIVPHKLWTTRNRFWAQKSRTFLPHGSNELTRVFSLPFLVQPGALC